VRVIPNKASQLNAAQVLHNKLTQKLGWELVLVKDGDKTIVAQSIAVQDIDAYARRDHGRPCRDAKVGMLPPKLAQTIVNLAAADKPVDENTLVLDPFCGSGVALQEAIMMGFGASASDSDQRMVDCTTKNLMWLLNQPRCPIKRPNDTLGDPGWRYFKAEKADATTHSWSPKPDTVASETYLGRPLTSLPSGHELQKIIDECDQLHEKFLKNLAKQIKPGFRLCLAVPAWRMKKGFKHLKTLDKLGKLGYNRVTFEYASEQELIYHRPGQVVARELLVLKRK
jgi:tRNA G10  N-methylase Trm11